MSQAHDIVSSTFNRLKFVRKVDDDSSHCVVIVTVAKTVGLADNRCYSISFRIMVITT